MDEEEEEEGEEEEEADALLVPCEFCFDGILEELDDHQRRCGGLATAGGLEREEEEKDDVEEGGWMPMPTATARPLQARASRRRRRAGRVRGFRTICARRARFAVCRSR